MEIDNKNLEDIKENDVKTSFFKGLFYELKSVSWPTTKETINLTILVIGVSFIVALYLGAVDFSLMKLFGILTSR